MVCLSVKMKPAELRGSGPMGTDESWEKIALLTMHCIDYIRNVNECGLVFNCKNL